MKREAPSSSEELSEKKREQMSGLDFVLGTKERERETGKNRQSPDPSKKTSG